MIDYKKKYIKYKKKYLAIKKLYNHKNLIGGGVWCSDCNGKGFPGGKKYCKICEEEHDNECLTNNDRWGYYGNKNKDYIYKYDNYIGWGWHPWIDDDDSLHAKTSVGDTDQLNRQVKTDKWLWTNCWSCNNLPCGTCNGEGRAPWEGREIPTYTDYLPD